MHSFIMQYTMQYIHLFIIYLTFVLYKFLHVEMYFLVFLIYDPLCGQRELII